MTDTICAVCGDQSSFRWTDTHGVAVCTTCGLPYTLYHYENEVRVERRPTVAVKDAWLDLAREYWRETKRRVFPGSFDMGILRSRGGRTYSGATEDEMRNFEEWISARKERWPIEEPEALDAVARSGDRTVGERATDSDVRSGVAISPLGEK